MSAFHVDEAAGSDTAGAGTPDAPYQSIAFALFTHGQDAKVLVRKDANTPYDEPTQSALKKAKKGADGLEKKKKKAEELAEREAKANAAAGVKIVEKAPAPAPPSIMTEAKAGKGEKDRRGSKMGEKVRRKKSKGNALSPTTPGSGPSALP